MKNYVQFFCDDSSFRNGTRGLLGTLSRGQGDIFGLLSHRALEFGLNIPLARTLGIVGHASLVTTIIDYYFHHDCLGFVTEG